MNKTPNWLASCEGGDRPVISAVQQTSLAGVLDELVAAVQVELVHQVRAVAMDRAGADNQLFGDFLVAISVGHQAQDLTFTRCERRSTGGPTHPQAAEVVLKQLLRHRGIEKDIAAADGADGAGGPGCFRAP